MGQMFLDLHCTLSNSGRQAHAVFSYKSGIYIDNRKIRISVWNGLEQRYTRCFHKLLVNQNNFSVWQPRTFGGFDPWRRSSYLLTESCSSRRPILGKISKFLLNPIHERVFSLDFFLAMYFLSLRIFFAVD